MMKEKQKNLMLFWNALVEEDSLKMKDGGTKIMNECGIDLAGVKHQKTGFAILRGLEATTAILHSDRSIVKAIEVNHPSIVSIDAPLGKPKKGYIRVCERQLKKMKINVFPCMFTQMAKLTERGIKLAETSRKKGYVVIESYPGAAQDILRIPRKGKGLTALQNGLVKYGITGDVLKYKVTDHELDAITSAIVGKLFLEGKTISIGKMDEGPMVIPKPNSCFSVDIKA